MDLDIALRSALCGLASFAYCNKRPPTTLTGFAVVSFGPPSLFTAWLHRELTAITTNTLLLRVSPAIFAIYATTLLGTIVAYRLSPFHPLADYPGPILARISRFWAAATFLTQKQHVVSLELFKEYGPVVRTGPNHLIVRDLKAVATILGTRDPWPKHKNLHIGLPEGAHPSLISISDPVEHSKRRRLWDKAFTPSALKSYEVMLQARTQELVSCLSARAGPQKQIDVAQWLSFMALDFMGDFVFGGAFDFMEQGVDPTDFGKAGVKFFGVTEAWGMVPWSNAIFLALPKTTFPLHVKAEEALKKRRENPRGLRDLFYYLLNEGGAGGPPLLDERTLLLEAGLILAAGADTTPTALANALLELHIHPGTIACLRKEVDAAVSKAALGHDGERDGEHLFDQAQLTKMPYLNAVIQETLRLYPAVANGAQHAPPFPGIMVAGRPIPADTICQIPPWSLHRDPSLFYPFSESFWPERWLAEGPALAKEMGHAFEHAADAYIPFSYGPSTCIGRTMAWRELRLVLASLVYHFDFELPKDFDHGAWVRAQTDHGILDVAPLPFIVAQRKHE